MTFQGIAVTTASVLVSGVIGWHLLQKGGEALEEHQANAAYDAFEARLAECDKPMFDDPAADATRREGCRKRVMRGN